jgi:hypothetical protein
MLKLDRRPLWLWVAFSMVGYILLALWFPLLPYHNVLPLADVRSLAPTLPLGLAYAGLISLLFGFCIMAYRRASRRDAKLSLATLVAISSLSALPLLFVYPINANDLYRYVIRGRINSVYGADPFSVPPDRFANDPFLPLAGEWAGATSPYGPLWELLASSITQLSDNNLLLGMMLFKLLGLLAFLGSAVLLWMSFSPAAGPTKDGTGNSSRRAALTLLWAWNPALLLSFVANGHNDALLIFCLLLGYYFISRGHNQIGFLLLMLGPLVKPIGFLALPFFFISIWRTGPSRIWRWRFLAVSSLGALMLLWLAFLPFGSPWDLGRRLLQEATVGTSFSPATMLILIGQVLGVELAFSITVLARITLLLFGLFTVWLLWQTWRGRSALRSTADIFFAYLLQALNFRIWYAAWPFPWLLLDAGTGPQTLPARYRLRYGLWFLLTSQLSVILYGHVRVHLLAGSQLWAHILGIGFVFVLPLFLARSSKLDRSPMQM